MGATSGEPLEEREPLETCETGLSTCLCCPQVLRGDDAFDAFDREARSLGDVVPPRGGDAPALPSPRRRPPSVQSRAGWASSFPSPTGSQRGAEGLKHVREALSLSSEPQRVAERCPTLQSPGSSGARECNGSLEVSPHSQGFNHLSSRSLEGWTRFARHVRDR